MGVNGYIFCHFFIKNGDEERRARTLFHKKEEVIDSKEISVEITPQQRERTGPSCDLPVTTTRHRLYILKAV